MSSSEQHAEGIRPAWLDGGLFPFESRYAEVGGHRVHYVDEGEGPTLLLLHGNPTWSFVYRQVIAELSSEFRCVACDYPGFGLSEPAAGYGLMPADHSGVVADLIEHLDLRDYTLVAQDWGGPIGVHAAARSPERLARLVMANTWAWPVGGDLHFEAFSRLVGGPLGRLAIRRFNLFVEVMIPLGHRRRKLGRAEMEHYRAPMGTSRRRQASAVLPNAITASSRFLGEVERDLGLIADRPALVVWADGDIAFREKGRRRWEALLTRSTTTTIRGAGHYLQSDAPEEFAGAIRSWAA